MQRRFFTGATLIAMLFTSLSVHAQVSLQAQPASTNVGGAQYPQVWPDGRVTFRVSAPAAQKVAIEPLNGPAAAMSGNGPNGLGKAPFEMTKGADGYWMVTTPPAVPGLHYYYVLIDGAHFDDPSSQTFFANNRESSGVEVPEPGVDFYHPKAVPHGQVRTFWYESKITHELRRVNVYTPPEYDAHPTQRYPVLYLRHGGSEGDQAWTAQGKMNFILDNLLAAGKAKPMLVVMENSYAYPNMHDPNSLASRPVPGAPAEVIKAHAEEQRTFNEAQSLYSEVTVKETIPAVDANFRTLADREHRAVAGFSMGSVQTLAIGLGHLDLFSAIGVFSCPGASSVDVKSSYGGVLADSAALNKKLHLFWWGAGTAEAGIYNGTKATLANFDKAGIKYGFVEYPNLSHEWQVWRKQLNDFAPLLFRW
jgi:enterochelin esterase-like enzyme